MQLAKQHIDIGLFAVDIDAQLAFWKGRVGLPYDHAAKLGGGVLQHRFHAHGSIVKVNHSRHALAPSGPSGLTGLRIACAGPQAAVQLRDPDGNHVALVPFGEHGVTGIGIDLRVRNRDAHAHFWRHVMQFDSPVPGVYVCGDSRIFVTEDPEMEPGPGGSWRGYGWRYLTVQVLDCQAEHQAILDRGGIEGEPVRSMGEVAVVSFVRDPDGNFIEISQRASLVNRITSG